MSRKSLEERGLRRLAAAAGSCSAILALAGLGVPSLRAEPPLSFAVRDARVVPVSGPVLQRGTVVIRDGLITAVGADVPAPGDARVIEGKGLTVYPGLIDASSEIGLPETPAATAGTQAAPAPAQGEEALQRSFFRAADAVTDGGERSATARQAGITSVLAVPSRGLIAGQSAVLSLNQDRETTVVRSPVAMHVRLTGGGFRDYPGSLMGMFAYLRQQLLDARRYREAWDVYERHDQVLPRPETNRSLEALTPVVAGRMPLVLPGNTGPEIQRAIRLGRELGIRVWVSGGLEAARVAAELKAADVPVILSLRFPDRPTGDADEESLRNLQRRVEAPGAAAALSRAGVRFAFTSGGLAPSEVGRALHRVVRAGLAPADALRGMTLGAAELLGVERRLGSITPGKIANLVVTDGDLPGERTRVRFVFVDGRLYDGSP